MARAKKNHPSVRWWIGLTSDFRRWDIFGTILDPNVDPMYKDYIWFMGPFKSKEEAALFKRAELSHSNPYLYSSRKRGYRNNPEKICKRLGAGDIIIMINDTRWMIVAQRKCRYDLQNVDTLELARDVSLHRIISSMRGIDKG